MGQYSTGRERYFAFFILIFEVSSFIFQLQMNGRTASCDTTVGGYNVKKVLENSEIKYPFTIRVILYFPIQDTICALNTSVIHFSKELWGDPEAFRPERFLDESNNIINAEKVLAFGGGKVLIIRNLTPS